MKYSMVSMYLLIRMSDEVAFDVELELNVYINVHSREFCLRRRGICENRQTYLFEFLTIYLGYPRSLHKGPKNAMRYILG